MPNIDRYEIFFDGACEPVNPGGAMGCGAYALRNSEHIWQTSWMEPAGANTSNNVAEYLAFHAALDWCFEEDLLKAQIIVRGDSKLVIQQCFGKWKIKAGRYVELAHSAKKKVACFAALTGEWVPREHNAMADELSKAALIGAGIEIAVRS